MKKTLFFFGIMLSGIIQLRAQTTDPKSLYETAREFMKQKDYPNAIVVLNRALLLEPDNLPMNKDLALSYYLIRDLQNADRIIKPLLDRADADDQVFQIGGSIYKQLLSVKESEKVYRKGLRKFPNSGPLYNELGELLWGQQDYDAIKQWEEGIRKDPSYSRNYYNAAQFYFLTTDKIKSLLFGEIFVNMEPFSPNAPEVKQMLMAGYKKLFSAGDLEQAVKAGNGFEKAFIKTMNSQAEVLNSGITADNLCMLRTRFILNWARDYSSKYPYRLFEYHRQLLQEGMFEAYNQWLFGSAQNLQSFQSWINTHPAEYAAWVNFQKSRLFKIPASQNYW